MTATHSRGLRLRWLVQLAGTLVSACVGGQTGGEEAAPRSVQFPGRDSRDTCLSETPRTVIASIDETSPGGFSAASVLRYAEGTFVEPLHFVPNPSDTPWVSGTPLAIEPEGDEPLEVEIRYAGGELRYIGWAHECGRLEIDVQVTLRTESGAFDESVEGVLIASSPFEARLVLDFHTDLVQPHAPPSYEDKPIMPVHPLAGTLGVTATDDNGRHDLAFLELVFSFSELGANGHADGWLYGEHEGLRLAPLLATFGETCEGGYGFPLGLDEPPVPDAMAPSAQETLALLGQMQIDAVGDDLARSPFALDLEYATDSACGYPDDTPALIFEAMLSIAADLGDARIDGRWPVEVRARSAADAAPASVHLTFVQPGDVSIESAEIESLEQQWGVTGLEVEGYDEVLITLELTIEPATQAPTITGDLFIRGYMLQGDRSSPPSVEDGDVLGHLTFQAAAPTP